MSPPAAMMVDVAPDLPVTGPLVGRADELARLTRLAGIVVDEPKPGAVLLSGDAGVGKTRLLLELRRLASDAGWRVLVGHCLDFGDSALPYLPFGEAFARLEGESPELAEAVAHSHPAVTKLMPGRRLPSDTGPSDGQRIDRTELFEAVHAALSQLAGDAPLLLVVEDVHWADQSTRELLSFLFARQFSRPVSIVASYRGDDLHRRHPLRATAAEWARLPGMSRVQLAPLSDTDVRSLVRSLHPAPLRESDVHGGRRTRRGERVLRRGAPRRNRARAGRAAEQPRRPNRNGARAHALDTERAALPDAPRTAPSMVSAGGQLR